MVSAIIFSNYCKADIVLRVDGSLQRSETTKNPSEGTTTDTHTCTASTATCYTITIHTPSQGQLKTPYLKPNTINQDDVVTISTEQGVSSEGKFISYENKLSEEGNITTRCHIIKTKLIIN
jgi:hypothetical protein